MNKQMTSVSHDGAVYDIHTGSWLKHLHSPLSEALFEIATEDIQLSNGQKAGVYKAEKRAEYDALPDRSCSSAKKYLNRCSLRDFGLEWDKLIGELKKIINSACINILVKRQNLSVAEQHEILMAASNGHIGAMYWIGTALRDNKDDNCLLWLSMAHNRGHVGASYEMAAHLTSKGNHIEALRCLIVSADGGCDLAYMSIFDFDVLINMFKIKQVDQLENMLDELSTSHSSSAIYLKAILLLFQGKKTDGRAALEAFLKSPKKNLRKMILIWCITTKFRRSVSSLGTSWQTLLQGNNRWMPSRLAANRQDSPNFRTTMNWPQLLRICSYLGRRPIRQAGSLPYWRSQIVVFLQNECSAAVANLDSAGRR